MQKSLDIPPEAVIKMPKSVQVGLSGYGTNCK